MSAASNMARSRRAVTVMPASCPNPPTRCPRPPLRGAGPGHGPEAGHNGMGNAAARSDVGARYSPGGAMHSLLDPVDWAREGADAVELLRALLRFDTTNPPGAEAECIAFLADHLRAAGLEPELLSPGGGRANLVVRLRGRGEGTAGPLLLHGHVDVVAAEAARWQQPPFGGGVHDGQVWGRGAVDMKNMVAMSAAVIALLARREIPLRR